MKETKETLRRRSEEVFFAGHFLEGGPEQQKRKRKKMKSYRISSSIFLLRSYNRPAARRFIQSSLPSNHRLALARASAGFAPDFGHGVPVVGHSRGCGNL